MTSSFLPNAGEESSFPLDVGGFTVRHGSSLSLMSNVCEFLANPVQEDSFNYVDPTADHHKWARKGLGLYYAAVVDNKNDNKVVCALRAATNQSGGVFLIDYVYSAPDHRDKGIAGKLIKEVLLRVNAAKFVLSIEESCVYWLEKHGFVLCENEALKERLNVFPDTHLLVHQSDNRKEILEGLVRAQATTAPTTKTASSTTVPPSSFANCLKDLQIEGTSQEGLPLCLKTLATLIRNAKEDESDNGKRQTIRINNPQVHRRVFALGGETAMNLLQVCGFELGVNADGDTTMQFVEEGPHTEWLDAAVQQLLEQSTRTSTSGVGW